MNEKSLNADSSIYSHHPEIYHRFAMAEDALGLITSLLEPYASGARVLEIGCGTGKYASFLGGHACRYVGLDASWPMISFCKRHICTSPNTTISLLYALAESNVLRSDSFDLVFACWVIGTIQGPLQRKAAIENMKRSCIPGGLVLLVENDLGGAFEIVRGRYPNIEKTQSYNSWLEEVMHMRPTHRFETHFDFGSIAEARGLFSRIWGESAGNRIKDSRLSHRIVIYEWKKPA